MCMLVVDSRIKNMRGRGNILRIKEYLESSNQNIICSQVYFYLPRMLRDLRSSYFKLREVFQANDTDDRILFASYLQTAVQGPLGCQVVREATKLFLNDVIPNTEQHFLKNNTAAVSLLGEKLMILMSQLRRCYYFLPCENKSAAVGRFKKDVSKFADHLTIKAMSEFDRFLNLLELYMQNRK